MSEQHNSFACCGIAELANICDDESPVESILSVEGPNDQGVIIFSDIGTTHYRHGLALAKYIEEHKLGSVTGIAPTLNPNTDNKIRVWMWSPIRAKLKRHQRVLRKKLPKAKEWWEN